MAGGPHAIGPKVWLRRHRNLVAVRLRSKVGRLLDESGVAGYGNTEAEAIVETCKAVGITVLPRDL